jgi:hypothetical protein
MTRRSEDDFAAEMAVRKADTADPAGLHGATLDHASSSHVIIERARQAISRLIEGRTRQDWFDIGDALALGRTVVKTRANIKTPNGAQHARLYSAWLAEVGLANIDKIDKSTRARLLDLVDHKPDVLKWLATVPLNKQLEWNHPRTLWQHWQKSKISINTKLEKPTSHTAKLKESIASLSEENQRLKSLNGGNAFTSKDRPADVVRILVSTFSSSKLTQIRSLLGKEIKR